MDKAAIYNQLVNTPTNGVNGIDLGQLGLSEGRPSPVVQGEDGQMYLANEYLDSDGNWQTNPDFSTPVYYFHQPLEAGDARGNYAEYSDDLQSAEQQGYWRTEEEIKAYWDGEGATDMNMFQQTNPDMDFGTYMSFIKENSALHAQGVTPESDPDAFAGITEKYGIQTSTTDNDNVYGWNGSNYTKTFKPEDPNYGRMLWGVGAGLLGAQALAPVIGGFTGAAPAGLVGPPTVGNIVGGKVATGLAAGAANAGTQYALTGSVDPASVLSSAVVAGVNPGGMLSDNFGKITGTGKNLVPSNVVGGFVSGAGNSAASQLITDGGIDLQSTLLAGGIGAGKNVVASLFDQTKQFSVEAEMQRIADQRASEGLPALSVDELYSAATGDPNFIIPENSSGSMTGPPSFEGGTMVGKSNLAGLIGEDGLLPFIPEVSTGMLNKLTGGGQYDPTAIFTGPDGKEYTDIELYQQGISPVDVYYGNVPGFQSYKVQPENTLIGDAVDYATTKLPVVSQIASAANNVLDVAANAQFESQYGINPDAYIAGGGSAQDLLTINSYGPLNESYNFSTNPRGQSQYVGLLTGIDDGFSTGSNNDSRYMPDGRRIDDAMEITGDIAISDAGKDKVLKGGSNNVLVNLGGGETTVVDGGAVLPGSNITVTNAVLQGIIDGALLSDDDLLEGTVTVDKDDATSSTAVSGVTSDSSSTAASSSSDTSSSSQTVASTGSSSSSDTGVSGDLNTGGVDPNTAVTDTTLTNVNDVNTTIDTNSTLTGTEVFPSSVSVGGGGTLLTGNGNKGLPVLWGELDPYTKFRGYAKKRQDLYNKMMKSLESKELKGMLSGGIASLTPRERELFEAGELKR